MKTLDEQLLDIIRDGERELREIAAELGLGFAYVRAAAERLHTTGSAYLVRHKGSRTLILSLDVPSGMKACPICRALFAIKRVGRKMKQTCGRSCGKRLALQNPTEAMLRGMQAARNWQSSPEGFAHHSELQKHRWAKPGARERQSQVQKDRWKDPAFRILMSVGNAKAAQRPESKERHAEASRRRWATPGYREKHSQRVKLAWTDEKKQQQSEMKKAQWRDPEIRKRYLDGMRRRRKERQENDQAHV